jgi:hypothetical protein
MRKSFDRSGTEPVPNKLAYQLIAVFLLLHFLLIIFTFGDYGMSFDQPLLHEYGDSVVRFFSSLGHDYITAHAENIQYYGGLFELSAKAIEALTRLGWLEARNLTSALFGLLGIWATFRLGKIAFGPAVGLTAALFLTLTPAYYGHQFINPKDLPFAALYVLSLSYIVTMALDFPHLRLTDTIKTGLSIGAALGVRAGGLILFGLMAVGLCAGILWDLSGTDRRILIRKLLTTGLRHGCIILVLAWSVMLLSWPFAWKRHFWVPFIKVPFFRAPFVALQEFSHYPWTGTVFFEGRQLKPSELPPQYLLTLLANGLPEFIPAGWLLGLVAALRIRSAGLLGFDRKSLATCIIFLAGVGPLAGAILVHALLYDNFRQVLFTLPPLIILSAAGVWAFVRSIGIEAVSLAVFVLYLLGILVTVADMRALHPYEYTYFNHLIAGGLSQANQRFELEYWGTSFREAAVWLNRYYRPPGISEIVYSSNAGPEQTDYYMRSLHPGDVRFRRSGEGERANVYLLLRRGRQQSEVSWGRIIHTVGREGVSFLDIVEP